MAFIGGTVGDDTLNGGAGDDSIYGGTGRDSLRGGGGNDYINGGSGYDVVYQGGSYTEYNIRILDNNSIELRDTLPNTNGNFGTDTLVGVERINFGLGGAYDVVTGGAGNDTLSAGKAWSIIVGGGGNDLLNGKDNYFDTLHGGTGSDTLDGGRGKDILTGGTGADRFIFNSVADGLDTITDFNSAESDLIQINATAFGAITNTNDFSFNSANNTLSFKQDQIAILQGVTTFDAATSLVLVYDYLNGGFGNDSLIGGAGNDSLFGRAGDDNIYGGAGNDTLDGGIGNDYINGGSGYDVAYQGGLHTEYNIRVLDNNSIELQHTVPNTNGDFGTDTLVGVERINFALGGAYDVVTGGATADFLRSGTAWSIIAGGGGNDTLWGRAGNDTLYGGTSNDIIDGDRGNDYINGGVGYDRVNQGGSHTDYDIRILDNNSIELQHTVPNTNNKNFGTDTLVGVERISFYTGGVYDVVTGGVGNDNLSASKNSSIMIGGGGNDTLYGGTGNDRLYGGNNNDALYGWTGNDRLYGGTGTDFLGGEAGNDTLSGGAGKDMLTGGTGADRFVFDSVADGLDTITDFNSAESDLIQISASGFGGITNTNDFSFNSANNTLSFKQDQIAILQGVTTFDAATSLVLA